MLNAIIGRTVKRSIQIVTKSGSINTSFKQLQHKTKRNENITKPEQYFENKKNITAHRSVLTLCCSETDSFAISFP